MKKILFLISLLCLNGIIVEAATNSGADKKYRPVDKDTTVDIIMTNGDTIKQYHFYKDEWYETYQYNSARLFINGQLSKDEIGVKNGSNIILPSNNKALIDGHEALDSINIVIHHDTILGIDTLYLFIYMMDTTTKCIHFIDQTRNKILDTIVIPFHANDTILSVIYTTSALKLKLADLTNTIYRFSVKGKLCSWINGQDITISEVGIPTRPQPRNIFYEIWSKISVFLMCHLVHILASIIIICFVVIGILSLKWFLYKKAHKGTSNKQMEQESVIKDDVNNAVAVETKEEENSELTKLKGELELKNNECDRLKGEKRVLETAKSDLEKEIKPLRELKQKYDEKVKSIEDKANGKIAQANKERDAAKTKANNIKKEVEKLEAEKYAALEKKKKEVDEQLENTKSQLAKSNQQLEVTKQTLEVKTNEVTRLNKAQEFYNTKLTVVEFAASYASDIKQLLRIATDIQIKATGILEQTKNIERVLKTLTKFYSSIQEVNLLSFYTDVEMISNAQMVLNSRALATYNQNGANAELYNSMILYFYDNYLMKYIDALVVLNESLLALDKFGDVSSNLVKPFVESQGKINAIVNKLGLAVDTVHLFDDTEDKMDLDITTYHGDFEFGTIVEIDNCWVYIKGGNKPTTKIRVKAQG